MYELDVECNLLSRKIVHAAYEVHRTLGPGYLEKVYEEALVIELNLMGINFERQKPISINYKGYSISKSIMDLVVENKIIIEIKAVESFAEIHKAQVISYLKATHLKLGLLINFNVRNISEGIKRVIFTK